MPSDTTIGEMLHMCSERVSELVACGVDERVALDRTWDAYEQAINHSDKGCFDTRDRMFENRLRAVEKRGI
jgi:hypothetical protein